MEYEIKQGMVIYSASWGACPRKGSCIRATPQESLEAFLASDARKCSISAYECGGVNHGCITIIFNLGDPARVPHFREQFTRKEAKAALDTGRFAACVPTMLPPRQQVA